MSILPWLGVIFTLIGMIVITRPRKFYIIRHGETLLNAQHIRQGSEGALSETGRRQALKVALYLKKLPVDRIISSTYERARETSAIIAREVHAQIVYSPLLVERKNPSEIIGKHTKDPDVIKIVDKIDLAYHEDSYRYSDEENFLDLKRRAEKCLDLFAKQGAPHTVIVTHHQFLKMLVATMLYRDRLHASDFVKLSFFNVSDNAGITICEFHPLHIFSKTHGWKVISYNEQPE